jgi:hypothetical protein
MHIQILHYIFIYALTEEQYYTFHRRSELIGCGWVYIFQNAYTGVHIKTIFPGVIPGKNKEKQGTYYRTVISSKIFIA